MGVLDKIKNALFEVEYVEVEEPPKKEKEKKPKFKDKFEKKEVSNEDPIAKKIILPGKKNKVEHLEDVAFDKTDKRVADEVADEIIQMENEESHDRFKIMDDNDFKVEDDYPLESNHIVSNPLPVEKADGRRTKREDFYESNRVETLEVEEKKETPVVSKTSYESNSHNTYNNPKDKDNKLYGVDSSYSVPVHEYGTYEKKEERTYFKPSPIISPIYGILDKNYRKEDVVQKKDIRLTTNYTRSNVSVDDIRDKAYGDTKKPEVEVKEEISETKFDVEDDGEDDNLLVDLSDRAKPEVKELTVGDAVEYFQDLGLEYNVDYVDVSKQNSAPKVVEQQEKKVEQVIEKREEKPIIHSHVAAEDENIVAEEMDNISYDEPKMTSTIEVKDESKGNKSNNIEDDDNLFDLIDSMYQENE